MYGPRLQKVLVIDLDTHQGNGYEVRIDDFWQ